MFNNHTQGQLVAPSFMFPGSPAGLFVGVTPTGSAWIAWFKNQDMGTMDLSPAFVAKFKKMVARFEKIDRVFNS